MLAPAASAAPPAGVARFRLRLMPGEQPSTRRPKGCRRVVNRDGSRRESPSERRLLALSTRARDTTRTAPGGFRRPPLAPRTSGSGARPVGLLSGGLDSSSGRALAPDAPDDGSDVHGRVRGPVVRRAGVARILAPPSGRSTTNGGERADSRELESSGPDDRAPGDPSIVPTSLLCRLRAST